MGRTMIGSAELAYVQNFGAVRSMLPHQKLIQKHTNMTANGKLRLSSSLEAHIAFPRNNINNHIEM